MTATPQHNTEVLLVDLSSLVWPLWHMNIDDPDPNAASTKALARIRAMVPEGAKCAICTDTGRSFRKDLDAQYKANRTEKDARVTHQLGLAAEKLRADGYTVIGAAGFEADDIIATATRQLTEQGASVRILSSDKDLMQLVCPTVRQQSLTDGKVYDDPAVLQKFGVGPEQMRDFLSLVGDASDNITGVKGVGPVKAAQVLRIGTLDRVMELIANQEPTGLHPGIVAAIAGGADAICRARELVTLRTDAPIAVTLSDLARKQPEPEDMMPEQDDIDYALASLPADAVVGQTVHVAAGAPTQRPLDASPVEQVAKATAQTALARRDDPQTLTVQEPEIVGDWTKRLEPRNLAESARLAEFAFASRLFSAYGNAHAVLTTIMAGREYGLSAMASLRSFHIIDGKPTMAADLIRAIVIKSGAVKFFRCTERTDQKATFQAQRGDDPTVTLTYTIEEARKAWSKDAKAWDNSAWGKSPADMLVARAGSKLARLIAPDVVHGIYSPEEMDNGA